MATKKIGVVGLPNVGKSTFFNAHYKQCGIRRKLSFLVQLIQKNLESLYQIPVKGASTGAGLGNNFLSHIRAVDAIFHVVRAFSEEDVIHVEGNLDPVRDLEIIHNELRLKDEEFLTKKIEELSKITGTRRKGGSTAIRQRKKNWTSTPKSAEICSRGQKRMFEKGTGTTKK
ncbi:unnamed protein product [Rhizophagus irregularis]|nr:unnamed protein product [Rhizophagus irregularis]